MTRPGDEPFALERIAAGLPVGQHLSDITAAAATGTLVVEAPPGTGKTTVVPPLLANHLPEGAASHDRVVVTQPRRVAARSAAARLAALADTRVGELVGHAVRGDVRRCAATRVEFCTTGVLVRRLLNDPELPGVHTVVLDEVHERHIADDLALGMLAELRELRPDLRVVAMSATLDATRFASVLGDAPVVSVTSDLFPLTTQWAPPPAPPVDERGVTREFLDHVADATLAALPGLRADASALVFVPGVREVDQVCARLRPGTRRPVLPLHGRLDAADQDAAIHGSEPRVVVSTAVAESSVTVAGVRLVVDSGLAREPRYDSTRDTTGLVTVTVSRATATQRAGRAARLGPGVVVRCLAQDAWARLPADPTPEIRAADLTSAALDLAVWGAPGGRELPLPDPLPPLALSRAERALRALGAITADGTATAHGRLLAAFPTDPRLAHALLAVTDAGTDLRAAAEAAAFLDEMSPLPEDAAAELHRIRQRPPQRWRGLVDQLLRTMQHLRGTTARGGHGSAEVLHPETNSSDVLGQIVAHAHPDRIAHRRGESNDYLLTGGTGATAPRGWNDLPEWIAVADLDVGPRGARIRSGVPIDTDLALTAAGSLLSERDEATFGDDRLRGRRVRRLGAIELASTPARPSLEAARDAITAALTDRGLAAVGWDDSAEQLRRRLAFVQHHCGAPWPDVTMAHLTDTAVQWLAPEIARLADGGRVRDLDLTAALRRSLPWPAAGRLDELAPERLHVPSGSRIRVDYPETPDQPPVVAVKLQECFGLTTTPRLADGRAPVLFHLLSPAGRPLAVTDDLASFWAGPYAQVRAENRGRYSKHPWPEDPLTAPAQRGTKKSGH